LRLRAPRNHCQLGGDFGIDPARAGEVAAAPARAWDAFGLQQLGSIHHPI